MATPSLLLQRGPRRVPYLELLPPEIFEMVAGVTDDKALLALRLSSRVCASKVLKTYTKVFFTEILLRIRDEASFLKCMRISKHQVFRRAVRTITISTDRCVRDKKHPRECFVKHNPQFEKDGLMLVFEHLARYTKTTDLRIVLREKVQGIHVPGLPSDPNLTCKLVSMDILRILRTTPLRISSLDISTRSHWGLPISEMIEPECLTLSDSLLRLQKLSLTLWRTDCAVYPEHEIINVLLRVIASSNSLKHLSLNVQSHYDVDPLELMLENLHFAALKSLQLQGKRYGMCVSLSQLERFLRCHKGTLDSFHMTSMCVGDEDGEVEERVAEQGLATFLRAKTGLKEIVVDKDCDELFLACVTDR